MVEEQTTLVNPQTTKGLEQTTLDTKQLIAEYLDVVLKTRSTKTHKTYNLALKTFVELVQNAPLTTETFTSFLIKSSEMNPSTQALYCSAIIGLYIYASQYLDVNIAALVQARKRYARRRGQRFPVFDKEAIEKVITYCENLKSEEVDDLRDRAFILTLVDTGLRISEACALRRGDIDWNEGRAVIIGKGDKQAVVRFSDRCMRAIKEYLVTRAKLDGQTGKPLTSLPLFIRHGKSAGSGKVREIKSGGMWLAIKKRMKEAGVDPQGVRIHDFRHYFVTAIYASSNDLLATQKAARHSTTDMTARYAHLSDDRVDRVYDEAINRRHTSRPEEQ